MLGGAKSRNTFFCSHLMITIIWYVWLGTVKDEIHIYRLKIIKNSEKLISRFWAIGFVVNSVGKGYSATSSIK